MRILFYSGIDVSLTQGHAVHVRRLTEALLGRGHSVRLLALPPEGPVKWEGPPDGIRYVDRPTLPKVGQFWVQVRFRRAIQAEIRTHRPAVVLGRLEPMNFALHGMSSGQDPPLCVESNSSTHGQALVQEASVHRIRAEHSLERRTLRCATVIGAVSEGLGKVLAERYSIDPAKIRHVPNGTWLPELDPAKAIETRRRRGVGDGEFLLGFIGSLSNWQGLPLLLETMARLRDRGVRLWIVGDGEDRVAIESRIHELGIGDRVSLLGGADETAAADLGQACQLLTAPYPPSLEHATAGGDPLKVLQAMACDRPVLVSARSVTTRVDELAAGETVSEYSSMGWERAIESWWSRWDALGRPLEGWPWPSGDGPGRGYVQESRSWDRTAEIWERIFEEVTIFDE